MNEKLIRRAAIKYRNWLLSQARSPVNFGKTSVLESLSRVSDKASQMEVWARRFFTGSTQRVQRNKWDTEPHIGIVCASAYERIATTLIPDLGLDVIHSTQSATAMLKSLTTKQVVTVLSPKEAIDEIRVVVNAWPEVEFRGNVLSVRINNVNLDDGTEEVYLGDFWIRINLTCPLDSLRIDSISQIESQGGYTHPHVSSTKLCIGAGGLPSQDALCQGRLEDFFRVVEAVLRTYNDASPHERLSEWYDPDHEGQFYCEGCDEWRSDDSGCWCEGCQYNYCEYCDTCGGCCTECGEWRCGECSTSCHGCQETLCHGCGSTCHGCDNQMCSSCVSGCAICDGTYCDECKSACAYCGDPVCNTCMITCGCCEDECCSACVDERCEECSQDICKGCQASCSECDKTVCNRCNDNSCEHCGTPMCGSCEGEHNCLLEGVTNESS